MTEGDHTVVEILNNLLTARDDGQVSLLALLDPSAAFDTINQDILLHLSEQVSSIQNSVLSFFQSSLRVVADIGHSHSRKPCNSKLTRFCGICCVQAQSHTTKHYLAVAQPLATCEQSRTGPVLSGLRRCCCQSHSQHKQQPEMITAAMGKGRDDECQVVGKDSFALPTGCHLSTVASVSKVLWHATTS